MTISAFSHNQRTPPSLPQTRWFFILDHPIFFPQWCKNNCPTDNVDRPRQNSKFSVGPNFYFVLGPYSREDHLTLGFFRNFEMRSFVTAELRESLFSNYLRKTVVAEFRLLTFMQNTPFFPNLRI